MRWDLNPRTMKGAILSRMRFNGLFHLELQWRSFIQTNNN